MFHILNNKLVKNQYKIEFNNEILITNIFRAKIMSIIIIFINSILLLIDFLKHRPMWDKIPYFKRLCVLHIIIVAIMILFLVIIYIGANKKENIKLKYYKILKILFIFIILFWCEFVSINDQSITTSITVYLIGTICIASVLVLNSICEIIFFLLSNITFIVILMLLGEKYSVLYGNVVNSIIISILGMVIAKINYDSFAKNFSYKIDIMQKNTYLEEYEKLRTEFFVNICHEFKTPLNIIFCSQQMLNVTMSNEFYANNKNKFDKYQSMIKQNCYRLMRLVNNMIDITKTDTNSINVNFKNRDIVKLIKNIVESVAAYTENKGKKLYFNSTVDSIITACDEDMIEKIILNLLSNAIKFTPEYGEIHVYLHKKDNFVLISVKDSGLGIPKEKIDLIFNRFVRLDTSLSRNSEGSGIGLTLVKSFVEIHKGNIIVTSELGKGSEFLIELPIFTVEKEAEFVEDKNDNIEKINIEFSDIYFKNYDS